MAGEGIRDTSHISNIEQIYKDKHDKILYSFKKSLKRNIVTIMAKILNNQNFIDLNLMMTPEHMKRILKKYVNGSFSFSDYILSISKNHAPDEYDDEDSELGY